MNTEFVNPYEVMNLSQDATEDEIKERFKKVLKVLHPDKCPDPQATEAFESFFLMSFQECL